MIDVPKSLRSFVYAIRGILKLFKNENNARIHLLASVLTAAVGFYFHISREEWAWLTIAVALVWITEAINTAIEKMVDFISPEFNPRAGEIKDMSAGAVLIAAIFSVIIGLIIFLPKILVLLGLFSF